MMPRLGEGGFALIRCAEGWTFIPKIRHLDGNYFQQDCIVEIHTSSVDIGETKAAGMMGSNEATAALLTEDMIKALRELIEAAS